MTSSYLWVITESWLSLLFGQASDSVLQPNVLLKYVFLSIKSFEKKPCVHFLFKCHSGTQTDVSVLSESFPSISILR